MEGRVFRGPESGRGRGGELHGAYRQETDGVEPIGTREPRDVCGENGTKIVGRTPPGKTGGAVFRTA
jgi:hypothetical protein